MLASDLLHAGKQPGYPIGSQRKKFPGNMEEGLGRREKSIQEGTLIHEGRERL